MARRRIRRGDGEGGGTGDPGRRRRGWWNRKPPPRGSLVPRSTISRQHNSSPLVHSPQPSGTAETSTLILLAGSLPPSAPYHPHDPPFARSPCPHSSLALAGERPTASLVLFLPQLHPSVPSSHARTRLHPATPPSRPLCFNNTVYIGTRSIDLFARRPPRVRRARRWTYRTYGQGVVP